MAPRPITPALLADIFTAFNARFQGGFAGVTPSWSQFATEVPSSAASEKYAWLGQWPGMREWIGDRHVKELAGHSYEVVNKDFESTVKVPRNNIADDQIGIFAPMFDEMGRMTAAFPDQLCTTTLAAGFTGLCYDGQPFFDDEHPVGDGVVSNSQGGSGAFWALMDTSRALKPIIYQKRQSFDFTALDKPTDPNVFNRKEFVYGVDGRANAGYGFWQMAVGSKQDLDDDNYEAARVSLRGFKDDEGKPLGNRPTTLVVGGSLEGPAKRLIENQLKTGGESNEWAGSAKLLVLDWL